MKFKELNTILNFKNHNIFLIIMYICILLLTIVCSYFYFNSLSFLPLGYSYDNLSIVSSAICLSNQGTDEHGTYYPLYFFSLGDYKVPAVIYLLSFVNKIFPLNLYFSRLITVSLGLIGLVFIYLITKKNKNKLAYFITFLFVLSNLFISSSFWSIQRSGFEVGYTLVYNAFLYIFCIKGLKEKNNLYSLFGVSLIFFSIFLYQSYKVIFIPILFFYFLLLYSRSIFKKSQLFFITIFSLSVIIIFIFFNQDFFFGRFKQISSDLNQSFPNFITIIKLYFKHLNINFLFFHGDKSFRHFIGDIGSFSYGIMIPFLIGIYIDIRFLIFRKKRNSFNYSVKLFTLFFFLTAFFPAAIINAGIPHVIRSYNIVLFLILYSLKGFYFLFIFSSKRKVKNKNLKMIYMIVVLFCILLSIDYIKNFKRKLSVFPILSYFSQGYWTENQLSIIQNLLLTNDLETKDLILLHRKKSSTDLPLYFKYIEIIENRNLMYCTNTLYPPNNKRFPENKFITLMDY